MPEEYFTVREVADKLKVRPKSIRQMVGRGQIGVLRIGLGKNAHMRIPASELQRLLREAVTSATSTVS
ncbi:MAG: helix-turn-helix domain-containing protein [Planctomycetota bacterium]|nr:helix-turn-helix domain-containing protein [Planctomycetota bacterium]